MFRTPADDDRYTQTGMASPRIGRTDCRRTTVPRALWPCTYDASFSPSGQSCLDRDPDPFIAPASPTP